MTNKDELKRWTALLKEFLLRQSAAAQNYQKPYYFGGGIAIDLTFVATNGTFRTITRLELFKPARQDLFRRKRGDRYSPGRAT